MRPGDAKEDNVAFVAGFATAREIAELQKRGWEVEKAEDHGLIGEDRLMEAPTPGSPEEIHAIVVFVDSSVFEIMSGPDWDKGEGNAV
jgi:hypothetical protein